MLSNFRPGFGMQIAADCKNVLLSFGGGGGSGGIMIIVR